MTTQKKLIRKSVNNQLLCKRCHKKERVTLYYCQSCREEHNFKTRELKRKYRREGKCVMCATESKTRLCSKCQLLTKNYIVNSKFIQSKEAKAGKYGQIKEIVKLW